MADQLTLNEGKQWIGTNVISGASLYAVLLFGVTCLAGTITAVSELVADLEISEEDGTNYARQAVTLGAMDSSGVLVIPEITFDPQGVSDWHSNVSAWGLVSAAAGGVGIHFWDLSQVYDMSVGIPLVIESMSWFFANPGEI